MTTLNALRLRFPRLLRSLAALAFLGTAGGAAAYEQHAPSCCHAGAACCHPGASCCNSAHNLASN